MAALLALLSLAERRESRPRRSAIHLVAAVGPSIVAIAGACGDLAFGTRGLYEARASGYRLASYGHGVVPSGTDVAADPTGVVWICPIAPDAAAPIRLVFQEQGVARFEVGEERGALDWQSPTSTASLTALLRKAGHSAPDEAELEESLRAIQGGLSGGKAMLLEGQTQVLEVIAAEVGYGDDARVGAEVSGCEPD